MTTATRSKPRVVERRIRSVFAEFSAVETDASGKQVERLVRAQRGELVSIPLAEACRLDYIGALCPPGQSEEELAQELEERYASYAAERRSASGGGGTEVW